MTSEEKRIKARWARILRVYGLTQEDYEKLDLGYCPICLREWSLKVRPCIDHNHSDLRIRGICCLYCNHRVIGRHKDPALIYRLYEYLSRDTGYFAPPKPKKKRKKIK